MDVKYKWYKEKDMYYYKTDLIENITVQSSDYAQNCLIEKHNRYKLLNQYVEVLSL